MLSYTQSLGGNKKRTGKIPAIFKIVHYGTIQHFSDSISRTPLGLKVNL